MIGIKVWICRGEVYGKKGLAPNFAKQKETGRPQGEGRENRGERRDRRNGERRGGFRNNKK